MFSKQPWMYNPVRKFYNDVIDQSLRVQNSHHLERTTSTGGNQSTWTFSAWIKRSKRWFSTTYLDSTSWR